MKYIDSISFHFPSSKSDFWYFSCSVPKHIIANSNQATIIVWSIIMAEMRKVFVM